MTTVAVLCIQLLRDLDRHRGPLDAMGWTVRTPEVPGQHLEGAALVAAARGCAGVIAGDDKFTRDVLRELDDLRVISKWGIGIDGIDIDAARERGVVVRNTPGVFDDEVADVTMAYIVMVMRRLVEIDRGVHAGDWPKPPGHSLRGRRLGIIGLGGIGRAVARRALVSGMTVTGYDPAIDSRRAAEGLGVECQDVSQLLSGADVISVNCPLNDDTHHLLGASAFSSMKRGVYIVNTGRGPVISSDALVEALEQGIVAGCALDVMEDEPLPADDPLRVSDRVVFGSHNASNTLEASAAVHDVAIANLIEELDRA